MNKRPHTPQRAFAAQKNYARQRGILFLFTFDEWVHWWEQHLGSDWFSKRGRHKGCYQMARIGDKGAYKRSNVRCITTEQNLYEQDVNGRKIRGEDHYKNKLTNRQVRGIFLAIGTYGSIAKQFNVSKWDVRDIKKGRRWRHFTASI